MVDGRVHNTGPGVEIILPSTFFLSLDFHKLGEYIEQFMFSKHLSTRGVFAILAEPFQNDSHHHVLQTRVDRDVVNSELNTLP